MMPVIVVIVFMTAIWSTQRRLVILDENTNNAMKQIGVQLSCRFDALAALLDLTKDYARHESEELAKTLRYERSVITAQSTPDNVLYQEGIISDVLDRIAIISEQHSELKTNEKYRKTMDAVESFETMMHTSRLIYNDSVSKLNREIQVFPVFIIAGILGFSKKNYLGDSDSRS